VALADLREAIRAELEADTGVSFASGRVDLEAGSVRQPRGYVWVEGVGKAESAVVEAVEIHARQYLQFYEPRSAETPVDPGPMEEAAEAMRDALSDTRTIVVSASEVWLLTFAGVDFDYETRAVEATFVAYHESSFETG
jgi:hypothetical protein